MEGVSSDGPSDFAWTANSITDPGPLLRLEHTGEQDRGSLQLPRLNARVLSARG